MKTREEILRDKDYVLATLQLNLLNLIGDYKSEKKLKDYQLAEQLGVSKGYVSQLLNATFDHKLSKVVDLALACNAMPLLNFVDLDTFIEMDKNDKIYEPIPMLRPKQMTFTITPPVGNDEKVDAADFLGKKSEYSSPIKLPV